MLTCVSCSRQKGDPLAGGLIVKPCSQLGCTGVVCQDCYTRVFGEPILYFCPAHGLPVSTPKEDRQAFTDTASLQAAQAALRPQPPVAPQPTHPQPAPPPPPRPEPAAQGDDNSSDERLIAAYDDVIVYRLRRRLRQRQPGA